MFNKGIYTFFKDVKSFNDYVENKLLKAAVEKTFSHWLQNLYNLLTPNGILIFSVHDECLRAPGAEMPAKGILFSPNSEIQSLDKEEYGTTYVTERFVREKNANIAKYAREMGKLFGEEPLASPAETSA